MSDTVFAPTVDRKPARMRKTTADAADRAMVMIEHDGMATAAALALVGISRRSYQRYIEGITVAAPETARPLGGSQSAPAPLPLFDRTDRLAAVEAKADQALKLIDNLYGRLIRAAGYLNGVAQELADRPKD